MWKSVSEFLKRVFCTSSEEAYLSKALDHADLERRIRYLERVRKTPFYI